MNPGARPKLITSANESNSAPILEYAFNKRAANPSKKSKTAAKMIKTNAPVKLLNRRIMTQAIHPANKFRQVIILGICFIKNQVN